MRDVGIVMPVYEQKSAYLRAAIRSVLHQSYRKFKLVIVIDGASSKIRRIVRQEVKNDARVRVIVKSKNEGVAKALNRGFKSLLRHRNIRYLTWVSSDNIYYSKYLSTLRSGLRHKSSHLGLVYSSFRHIGENGRRIFSNQYHAEFMSWQNQPKENLLDSCFVGVSFMYKRKFAELAGKYELEPVEDYDYWLKLTDHCEIRYLPTVLMDYRTNAPHSISRALSSSVTQHRRWRYAFQLAKCLARVRRGIPVETTVIVPVHDASENTANRLESLYNQYYSNFKLLVMDTTPNAEATSALSAISDPRVAWLHVPGMDETAAIRTGVGNVTTPFTFVSQTTALADGYDLLQLRDSLIAAESQIMSASRNSSTGTVQLESSWDWLTSAQSRLYRTEQLLRLI